MMSNFIRRSYISKTFIKRYSSVKMSVLGRHFLRLLFFPFTQIHKIHLYIPLNLVFRAFIVYCISPALSIFPWMKNSVEGNSLTSVYLYGCSLFSWPSWLRSGLALYPVAEIGGFVTVKENK